ncbi:hypothetical protein [Synechococcus sp. BA-132 BA5]|uniref:hypothetical protein n=1 Tax=Synechococcus sp. BA-132 BA5 TaxID=3110252 RepID=UPI002B21F3A2|nr:hypothetical protein [Synechococcus sp. BA-132 BA5]MEA5413647.1 hypothetical protein [Synechococcus sp. BA-132 BA5]
MAVVAALLLSLLGLAALWGLLRAGLALYLLLMDRWSQTCRDAITSERLLQQGQRQQQALHRQRQRRRGWSLVDLDGRPLALEASQLEPFARRCRAELGLSGPCSVSELRRHWRRSSLRWHPDQGGDNGAWLRRLRAYEALRQLGRDPNARQLVKVLPPTLPARSRLRRPWRWF